MDGTISFTQGWPVGYELPVGNPARLEIQRGNMNQLFYDVTSAIQNQQQKETPPFITSTMNGGSPFSYSLGDRVISGGVRYISLANTNTDTPPTANWSTLWPLTLGGTGASTASGARTNLGLGTAAVLNVGTGASNIVQLNGSSQIPAVDAHLVTGLTASQISGLKISQQFTSSQQAITLGGTFTVSHGLTVTPVTSIYQLFFVCITGELGYTAGQVTTVNPSGGGGTSNTGISTIISSSSIVVRFGNPTVIANASTGAAANITAANWQAVVSLWA